jgi:outer membrane receptor for Fe3+-dicitrate
VSRAIARLKLTVGLGLLIFGSATAQERPAAEGYELPVVEVIGRPEALTGIPGSGSILDQETLTQSRVFTTNEALRKVPGTLVRDEEGFGLRNTTITVADGQQGPIPATPSGIWR